MFSSSYKYHSIHKSKIQEQVPEQCTRHQQGQCRVCTRLADLERKIGETRRQLDALLDEREKLAPLVSECHDPIIGRLPVEIISLIFRQTLPYPPSLHVFAKPFDGTYHCQVANYLTHVSRAWRSIALDMAELWTVVWVSVEYPRKARSSIEVYQSWLQRSKSLPLYVGMRIANGGRDSELMVNARTIVESLIHEARRWRMLSIRAPHQFISWMSSQLEVDDLIHVEHLRFHREGTLNIFVAEEDILVQMKCAPRLLTLNRTNPALISIDWTNLIECYISVYDGFWWVHDFSRLFQMAPRLSILESMTSVRAEDDVTEVITAPALRSLTIEAPDSAFWESFTFPSLNTLRLLPGRSYDYQISSLIRRSACRIEYLDLVQDARSGVVAELLGVTPYLIKLSLSGSGGLDLEAFVTMLEEVTSSTPGALDKLRVLDVRIVDLRSDFTGFATFLKSDLKSLERLNLSFAFPAGKSKYRETVRQPQFREFLKVADRLVLEMTDRNGEDVLKALDE